MRRLTFGLCAALFLPLASPLQAACDGEDCTLPENEMVRALARGVGRLDVLGRDGTGFCTGFIVAPNIVATAWNCVPGPTLEDGYPTALASAIMLDLVSKDGDGAFNRHLYFDPPFGKDSFGVSFLKLTEGRNTFEEDRVLTLSDTSLDAGASLATLAHVEGVAMQYLPDACKIVKDEDLPAGVLAHDCSLGKGSLGAPLIDAETGMVVAIHLRDASEDTPGLARSSVELLRVFPQLGGE